MATDFDIAILPRISEIDDSDLIPIFDATDQTIKNVEVGTLVPTINVLHHGVVGDGVTDDAPKIKAILESLGPRGGTLYFPSRANGQGRTYLVKDELVCKSNGVHFIGDGRIATTLLWDPIPTASNGTFLTFLSLDTNGVSRPIKHCSIGRMQIRTPRTGDIKTAIYAVDISQFLFHDMSISGFILPEGSAVAGDSIGIKIAGRDTSTLRDVSINAARPLVFSKNPNHSFLDADIINIPEF